MQAVLLGGAVECRSPELDQRLVVGRDYEIRQKELRAGLALLPEHQAATIRRYLHAEAHSVSDGAGGLLTVYPPLHAERREAFTLLWRTLAEQGWLHAPTRELGT